MEPIRPEVRAALLRKEDVTEEDLVEYEQLLAERFSRDPSLDVTEAANAAKTTRQNRIQELYSKIFS